MDGTEAPIRRATVTDVPIVLRFLHSMLQELASMGDPPVSEDEEQWSHVASEIRDSLEEPQVLHLLAEAVKASPAPVGWAYARITDLEAIYKPARVLHISALYVSRPYRRRGIGRAMLDDLLEWGQNAGCVEVELNVLVNNPARSLYKQAGFDASRVKMTRKLEQ